jgi:hypothetical protein
MPASQLSFEFELVPAEFRCLCPMKKDRRRCPCTDFGDNLERPWFKTPCPGSAWRRGEFEEPIPDYIDLR